MYIKQTFTQGLYFRLADGLCGCHQLTIAVGDTDDIAIDESEVHDAFANEAFGAPTSYATNTEDDDAFGAY